MLDGVLRSVHNLANNGIAAKAIQAKLAERGHHYCVSYIYKVCHRAGIHIMDYRRGENSQAKAVFKRISVPEPTVIDKPVKVHKKTVHATAKRKRKQAA